jgi:large subunit ribosomal protein L20
MKIHKKKIFSYAKGFYGRQKNCWNIAIRAVHRAWQKAYVGRKLRKRDLRKEWIQRINASTRQFGLSYAHMVRYLPAAGVNLNRKVLSDLAVTEPYTFRALVEIAQLQKTLELSSTTTNNNTSTATPDTSSAKVTKELK